LTRPLYNKRHPLAHPLEHVSVDVSRQYDPVTLATVEAYDSNPVTVSVRCRSARGVGDTFIRPRHGGRHVGAWAPNYAPRSSRRESAMCRGHDPGTDPYRLRPYSRTCPTGFVHTVGGLLSLPGVVRILRLIRWCTNAPEVRS
jgi:hypothetical protein